MYALHACIAVPGWVCTADILMIVDPRLFGLFSCFIHVSLFGVLEVCLMALDLNASDADMVHFVGQRRF